MLPNLCRCCKFFVDEVKTPSERTPKHCSCSQLVSLFGAASKGFIFGTKIIHCDYFQQIPLECSDVVIVSKSAWQSIGYIINEKHKGQFYLPDNSQNQKIVKL